ncbi:MAG: nitrile hydratase subunit beta [Betaproteobacteria bacterium]|nr:nitrile hydratase subunit beta [Betaproteobacteria bacterium]
MNGVHDMGGMQGFGPVVPETNEPYFHEAWEGRVLALVRTILYTRAWNLDMFRDSQERLPASVYLMVSYYHRWFLGIVQSALEKGYVTQAELDAGHSLGPAKPVQRTMTLAEAPLAHIRGPFGRDATREARFRPGDRVRTINAHPVGHTRLPRYARDKVGVIERVQGFHVYPDAVVAGKGEDPQWLYTVVMQGTDLWGPDSDPSVIVSIEAFEPYLEAV